MEKRITLGTINDNLTPYAYASSILPLSILWRGVHPEGIHPEGD